MSSVTIAASALARTQQQAKVVKALTALYTSSTTDSQFAAALSAVHPKIVFNDPITSVSGKAHYTAQFQSLRTYFHSYKPLEWQILSHSSDRLVLDCLVNWQLTSFGISATVRQLTLLSFAPEDGRIIAHEDIWSITDLIKSVPLIGFLYTRWRPFFGRVSSNWFTSKFKKNHEGAYAEPYQSTAQGSEWIEVEATHGISDKPEDFGVDGNAAKTKAAKSLQNQVTSRATSSTSTHKDL